MSKKRKKNVYFTKETEDAIVEYNNEDDPLIKQKIYRKKIEYPINKLVENIINRFKFPYFKEATENLQSDVVSFIIMNIHKYDQEKGRAFSYFSILVKNYLILGNNENYKFKKSQQIIDPANPDHSFDLVDEDKHRKQQSDMPEFIYLLIKYWENNINRIFSKKQEIMIADAILNLFKRSGNIENFNKKALYVMIREMTGLRTQYITAVVNKMKTHNEKLMNEYYMNGYFNIDYPITNTF